MTFTCKIESITQTKMTIVIKYLLVIGCLLFLESLADTNNANALKNMKTMESTSSVYPASSLNSDNTPNEKSRHLQFFDSFLNTRGSNTSSSVPYYTTNMDVALFPRNNYDIAIGNPLKGLNPNGAIINLTTMSRNIPASLCIFKWPIDEVMFADPDVVGEEAAFNWSVVERDLAYAAQNNVHVVGRFHFHYRGKELSVPDYLYLPPYGIDTVLDNNNETSLLYNNTNLRRASKQFIEALAKRYDGDQRIFSFQAGILGYWGEWHSSGCTYFSNYTNMTERCLPNSVKEEMVGWYQNAFNKTYIQMRYPDMVSPFQNGFGYHDDSFTFSTVGGAANGFQSSTFFFWTLAIQYNTSSFWKFAPMGGEIRPDNADDIFNSTYPAGTKNHQDFNLCTETTHATQMAYHNGWRKGGPTGVALLNAQYAHARMGYSFEIDQVSTTAISSNLIDIQVTIKQTGVAPFYFPLYLAMYCSNNTKQAYVLVNTTHYLIEKGDIYNVDINNVLAVEQCLNAVEFKLESPKIYSTQTIKWAQGYNNGRVILSFPSIPVMPSMIPSSEPSAVPINVYSLTPSNEPSNRPSLQPTITPHSSPSGTPSIVPSKSPLALPSVGPSSLPTLALSLQPSLFPTKNPSKVPSNLPTTVVSSEPTSSPTNQPSNSPSFTPTKYPSLGPSSLPTVPPSVQPSLSPTKNPSQGPSYLPTTLPSYQPSSSPPTKQPTTQPSFSPSSEPTRLPTSSPSYSPTLRKTSPPTKTPIQVTAVNCYLICASSTCNGNQLSGLLSSKSATFAFSKLKTTSLSIRCDATSNISSIQFSYQTTSYRTYTVPFAMRGMTGSNYNAVSYLSNVGGKSVTVTAYQGNNVIKTSTLVFTLRT